MMQFTIKVFCFIFFTFLIITTHVSAIPSSDVIRLSSNEPCYSVRCSESYHYKQRGYYTNQGPSETFLKMVGLTMAFSHTKPVLYKIRFQGQCYTPHSKLAFLYLRLMIDDHLLYVDKLWPNTANRYQSLGGTNNHEADTTDGFIWVSTSHTARTCAFSDVVYLDRGLHVIDVGVRGGAYSGNGAFPTHVNSGFLTVELIEYNSNADIGLRPINTTTYNWSG